MLISHSHKFIFIHIYKTAGTSVMDTFLPYSRYIDRLAYQYAPSAFLFKGINAIMGWRGHGMKEFTGYHKHAKAWEVQKIMKDETFKKYYKFTFVRNPYDFIVSHYFYIRQTKHHPNYTTVHTMNFSAFIDWYLNLKPPLQVDFLMDQNRANKLVDFVGKFEHLKKDTQKICQNLDIKSKRIKHKNPSKKRKTKNYKKYYTEKDRKQIHSYFKPDFEILKYSYN